MLRAGSFYRPIFCWSDFYTYIHIFSVEVVGKFPDESEAKKYNISVEKPIWLPTSEENVSWYEDFLPKLKNKWTL